MKQRISNIMAEFSRVMAAAGVAQEGDFDTARELLSKNDDMEQKYPQQQVDKTDSMRRPLNHCVDTA
ncbi:hypothetical protein ACFL6N_01880 [Thermodesulfobacteriota bacterium]